MPAAIASKRFELVRRLGEGGMGVVYEAIDRERGVRVALKTLRNASGEHLAWLKREFRAVQDVQHPNLVALHELLCEDGQWFLTMDLVEGVDFLAHVRGVDRDTVRISRPGVGEIESAPTLPTDSPLARIASRSVTAPRAEPLPFDEARLRDALRELAEGLEALHGAGMVHRDIKPSNVLVARGARVVLLDFGLVVEARSDASTVVGTPVYMAPEQATAGRVGPEADWYAVGVLLYEALTGRVPFDGHPLSVMMRKQSEKPARPRDLSPGVPADLDALAAALLEAKPSARPTGTEVLRRLGGKRDASVSRSISPPFVGRAAELGVLDIALAESREDAVAVVIEGESGLGKSRLVRQFTDRATAADPRAVVLVGRCYERESVPYKAFDGLVDGFARLLGRMPEAEARELVPTRPAPLVQVFPVLQRVPAFAALAQRRGTALDPVELRSRAFAALREMLARLGERRPLVLVIDDAQWADHDSLALLAEVTRTPDAPRMLLVVTVRGTAEQRSEIERAILANVRRIALGALAPEEARELAARTAPVGTGIDRTDHFAAIARESAGHPLFIDVLARQTAPRARSGVEPARLEDILAAQLEDLPEDARAIIEVVSLAQGPLRQRVVERAAEVTADAFVPALQRLRVARVVVTSGARADDRVEPYHDRVRAAAVARLSAARRKELHRRIALACELAGDDDPEALALHWRESGVAEQAAAHGVRAGDRAAAALAFDRAASFYQDSLALFEGIKRAQDDGDHRALLVKLGDALVNAGRGNVAADVLRRAAEGAPATQALELRRRAAEQLVRSGHFDEGVSLLGEVLASVGVRLPKTSLGAIVSFLFLRAILFVRGLRSRERPASECAPADLVRSDTCAAAAMSFAVTDTIRGGTLQARSLLEALRIGEPYRVARALTFEAAYAGQGGTASWRRCAGLLEMSRVAAERCGNPHAVGLQLGSAAVAHYLCGRFKEVREHADRAETIFREQCVGVAWELATVRFFAASSLAHMGELRELVGRSSVYLRETSDRGDLYTAVTLRLGHANVRWLVSDEPLVARRVAEEAMKDWSQRGFHVEHVYELMALVNIDLYEGKGRVAWDRMVAWWPSFKRSLLPWRIQVLRIHGWSWRGRAALGAAAAERGETREAALRDAEKGVRCVLREKVPFGVALAKLLEAGIVRMRTRDDAAAAALLREAVVALRAVDMALHASVAERVLGGLVGGTEGAALVAKADEWFRAQTVQRPDRFVAMLAPGLDPPERDAAAV